MRTTSGLFLKRKSAMLAAAISFTLATTGYALAQDTQQEEQEEREVSREELLEQQAQQALEENQPTDYSGHSLADMLTSEGYFSRFHEALQQTGLLEELEADQEYTVFAPFDEAFSRLPEGVWENWTSGGNPDEFRNFIAYHIMEGSFSADDLNEDGRSVTTLNGDDVELRSAYGAIMVGTISVNMPNIETNQGLVHGVDAVLGDLTELESQAEEEEDNG